MNETKLMIWLSRMKAVEKMTISGVTHSRYPARLFAD